MKNPQISIIIPIYNAEKYLRECIESIFNQTYKNFEIVAIDDGSSDDSLNILKEYAQSDSRLKITSQKNSGPAKARNRGLELAKGKYVMFVDSDDFIAEDTLEKLSTQAKNTKAELVMYDFISYESDTKITHPSQLFRKSELPEKQPFAAIESQNMFTNFPIITCTNFVSRELITKNKIKFENYKRNEDVKFCIDLILAAKKLAFVAEPLYYYRMGISTSETATNFKHPTEILKILQDTFPIIKKIFPPLIDNFKKYSAEQIIGAITSKADYPNTYEEVFDFAKNELIPQFNFKGDDFHNFPALAIVTSENAKDFMFWQLQEQLGYIKDLTKRLEATEERRIKEKEYYIDELEKTRAELKNALEMNRFGVKSSAKLFVKALLRKIRKS